MTAVKGAHLDVYRLEHTTCAQAGHGPFIDNECGHWLEFGTAGKRPDHIEKWESCGVTAEQAPYWWECSPDPEDVDRAAENGWHFVHYSVPVEECREHRGQILFVARTEYRVGVVLATDQITSSDVPGDRWDWHDDHLDVNRPGYELVAA